jgi:hypothetical protein
MVPTPYLYWFLAAAAALMGYLMHLASTETPPGVVWYSGCLIAVAAMAIFWASTPLDPSQVRPVLDHFLQQTHHVTSFWHYLIGRGRLQSEQSKSVYRDQPPPIQQQKSNRMRCFFASICSPVHGAAAQCDN